MSTYGLLSRLLHHIALGSRALREASFDLDQNVAGSKNKRPSAMLEKPTFVTGLARSGTSILLKTLYETEAFTTLTYRDMPFVLAPRLWRRIAGRYGKTGEERERAHADGIAISFDSPEAFEEVFWLTFAGDRYLRNDRLVAHSADNDTVDAFRRYVGAIINAADQGQNANKLDRRYLSKNNNNVLRLGTLRRAFPKGTIIVPFRNPYDQANSLLQQHRLFSARHVEDPFSLRYMRWLGHFEFGGDHRPFDFGNGIENLQRSDPDTLDHWLIHWILVYESILAQAELDLLLFDYDAFCRAPESVMDRVTRRLCIAAISNLDEIRAPRPYEPTSGKKSEFLSHAEDVHAALRARCFMESP